MKISYNWLKEYIDIDLDATTVARYLTNTGLEVEGIEHVESVKGGLEGIIIGEVLTKEPHPNADRLSITTVNIGQEKVLKIVCGAPTLNQDKKFLLQLSVPSYILITSRLKSKKQKLEVKCRRV